MKKFLLLLSCWLATWCGVQAATPSGRINSASYDANNSQINARFTSTNASKVELGFISQHVGIITEPLYKKSFGVINGATSLATLDVDPKFEEGIFQVLLYLNGSIYPSGNQQVNVTATGRIKNVCIDLEKETFDVGYSMQHGSAYNSSIRIYDETGKNLLYRENLKITNDDPNPNTNVNAYRSFSLPFSTLISILKEGKIYKCRLYNNEKVLAEYIFMLPGWSTVIKKLTQEGSNRIKVDFTLKDKDVNVVFRLYDTRKHTTRDFNIGKWPEHNGTTYLDIPSSNGPTLYVVNIITNGQVVNGAQINTK